MGHWIVLIVAGFMTINKAFALLATLQNPNWLRIRRLQAGLPAEINMSTHYLIQIAWIAAYGYGAYLAYGQIYSDPKETEIAWVIIIYCALAAIPTITLGTKMFGFFTKSRKEVSLGEYIELLDDCLPYIRFQLTVSILTDEFSYEELKDSTNLFKIISPELTQETFYRFLLTVIYLKLLEEFGEETISQYRDKVNISQLKFPKLPYTASGSCSSTFSIKYMKMIERVFRKAGSLSNLFSNEILRDELAKTFCTNERIFATKEIGDNTSTFCELYKSCKKNKGKETARGTVALDILTCVRFCTDVIDKEYKIDLSQQSYTI